jgi:peptide-methionine (S)-S-oxide reductase
MKNSDIKDPLFLKAVEAIDGGNIPVLEQMLHQLPRLVSKPLDYSTEGYFSHPYLLWFIADNPIRNGKLPPNIVDTTRLLLQYVKKQAPETFQHQIDYTLGLVATGRIPKEAGVQIQLMDLLIDIGAVPGKAHGALAHGNIDAARHLIERGGTLTLATAICLHMTTDIERLAKTADAGEREIALVAASFFGNTRMISFLIDLGVDVNACLKDAGGFHSHASALHQAVYAGSVEAVKLMVNAGAKLDATDRIYAGTPLDWSQYLQREESDETKRKNYKEIEGYLMSQE